MLFLHLSNTFITFAQKKYNIMISKEEVQHFLDQFNTKMKVFGIIYREDRGKNRRTLGAVDIVRRDRSAGAESLTVEQ